jgi:hypothetical protein
MASPWTNSVIAPTANVRPRRQIAIAWLIRTRFSDCPGTSRRFDPFAMLTPNPRLGMDQRTGRWVQPDALLQITESAAVLLATVWHSGASVDIEGEAEECVLGQGVRRTTLECRGGGS